MTGHNRIPTESRFLTDREFVALCESIVAGFVLLTLFVLVIA